jgi:hypothetical protein
MEVDMVFGVFYCYQIPITDFNSIDWLIAIPVRDWELQEALGQPVWMVRYNADHPDMQKYNRLQTCRKFQFSSVVFEDDVIDTWEFEGQETTVVSHKAIEVRFFNRLKAIWKYIIAMIAEWYNKKNRKREKTLAFSKNLIEEKVF